MSAFISNCFEKNDQPRRSGADEFSAATARLVAVMIFLAGICPSSAQDTLHLWIRAFIPNQHPGNPGYIKPIPGVDGRWVIPAPTGDSCFETDDRYFASDPDASYRVMAEIDLVTDGQTATTSPVGPRPLFNTGLTRNVDCNTGVDVVPPQRASTDGIHFGAPAAADGMAQIVVNASVGNPMYVIAPKIDFSGTFTYTTGTKQLRFQGSVGEFPAFEAYAQLNDGTIKTVFTMPPAQGTTAWSLIDLGLGLFDQNVDTTISLADTPGALLALQPPPQASQLAHLDQNGRLRLMPAAFSGHPPKLSEDLFCLKESRSESENCYSLRSAGKEPTSLRASARSKDNPEIGLVLPVNGAQEREIETVIERYRKAYKTGGFRPNALIRSISQAAGLRIARPQADTLPARFVPSVKSINTPSP